MWDGFNQRKFPRINLPCEIQLQPDADAKPIKGVTENVGTGGLCVLTKTPLERFTECRMKLELGDKTDIVECKGKVVWIVPTQDEKDGAKRFDVGIEFVDMDKKSKSLIMKYLEEFNAEESES